jgi:hypothetical protein
MGNGTPGDSRKRRAGYIRKPPKHGASADSRRARSALIIPWSQVRVLPAPLRRAAARCGKSLQIRRIRGAKLATLAHRPPLLAGPRRTSPRLRGRKLVAGQSRHRRSAIGSSGNRRPPEPKRVLLSGAMPPGGFWVIVLEGNIRLCGSLRASPGQLRIEGRMGQSSVTSQLHKATRPLATGRSIARAMYRAGPRIS